MSLVEHARTELQRAGLFDTDSDYNGGLGTDALELIERFAEQGHSGGSAEMVTRLFTRLARYEVLTPLDNPTVTGEYIDHGAGLGGTWQSTRDGKVFSDDGGKSWYHLDKHRKWWQRFLVWLQYAPPMGWTSWSFPNRWMRGRMVFK